VLTSKPRPTDAYGRAIGRISVVQPPNDADLLELLFRYAPDGAELQKILVANPATLFGFSD
jgi:2-pyrone-4,6-dicarboxylate lactonase